MSRKARAFITLVGLLAVPFVLGGFFALLQSHVAKNRTVTVRAVFLHPADAAAGPQVYMNDGTVWALSDAPENVRMIQGDKVRYVSLRLPGGSKADLGRLSSTPTIPDVCSLRDVTTGYGTEAVRLSAPFKHSSCPAR